MGFFRWCIGTTYSGDISTLCLLRIMIYTTFHQVKCCFMCFIAIVRPLLTHWVWLPIFPFTWSRKRSQLVWAVNKVCLLLLHTWLHLLYIMESMLAHSPICISYSICEIDGCLLYMSFYITRCLQTCYQYYKSFRYMKYRIPKLTIC
jgi:hypothetical protein